jgi:hypothetical protein
LRVFYARPSNQIRGRLLKSRFAAKSTGETSPLHSKCLKRIDGICYHGSIER